MWETRPGSILTPGLQVSFYSGTTTKEKLGTAIVTVVGPKKTVLRILGRNAQFRRGMALTAVGVARGVLLKFQTDVQEALPLASLLSISSPSSVGVRGLRKHERVALNCSCVFRPFQTGESGRPYPEEVGTVLDISKGGLSVASASRPQSDYLVVKLQESSDLQLQADLSVRHTRQPTTERSSFVSGLQFLLIDPETVSSIELFVATRSMGKRNTKKENGCQ